AVRAVQLHAVEARLARAPRALGERGDRLLDVGRRHPLAFEPVQRIRLVRGAQADRVLDAGNVALPAAVTELHDVLAVVPVNGLADFSPERNALVAVDGRVVRDDAAAQLHRHERGDDGADAAPRELLFPVDARLIARAVVVVQTPGDVRPEHAI